MIKLLGAACILSGSAAVWVRQVSASRKELAVLREMLLVLDQMEGEVRLLRTPLPRLLRKLAAGRISCVSVCLIRAAAALEGGDALRDRENGILSELPVGADGQKALAELAEKLDGGEEQVCNGILLVRKELADILEKKRLRQKETEKRGAAMCFSAAALLIIILI